jgi:uncharacterized protein (UPF0332 family)
LKPETADALENAREHLNLARRLFPASASAAGREGYLAALTAARGLTFELKNKGPKSHSGVKALVHELVRDGLDIDRLLLNVFDKGFELKVTADYGDPRAVGELQSQRIIDMAETFVERVEQILTSRT